MELTIDKFFQKAIEVQKLGKLEDAESLYTRILQSHPRHPDTNYNMGELSASVGKLEEALSFFKVAIEANPSRIEFWLSYIEALIQLGRIVEAKNVLDQIKGKGASSEAFDQLEQRLNGQNEAYVIADPYAEAQNQTIPNILDTLKLDQALRLAKKKIKEGFEEEAKGIYQAILAKYPKNKKAIEGIKILVGGAVSKVTKGQEPTQDQQQQLIKQYKQGQHQQALENAKKLLLIFPSSATLYSICGAANAALGQHDAAIISYKNALKIKPDFADAYYNMGNILKDTGNLESAINNYKKALKIQPDYSAAYNNMGNALQDRGDLQGAIFCYKKFVAIQPNSAEAYLNLAIAQDGIDNPVAAIHNYKKALKIRPDYTEAYINIGAIMQSQGDPESALDSYKEALKIEPELADAYFNIGISQEYLGDFENAINSYKKALEINPDYTDAYNKMGLVFENRGDLNEAIDNYKQALKINSGCIDAYNNLGNILKSKGKLLGALGNYKQALDIKPDDVYTQINMGLVLHEQGDLGAAIDSYNKALKIKPNCADAYSNLGNSLKDKGELEAAKDAYELAIKYKQDHASAHLNLGLLYLESSHNDKAAEHFKLSGGAHSKHYLLRCLYLQDKKTLFYDQLDEFITQGEVHPIIGSLGCRAALKYGIKKPNLFCKDPLSYVFKTDLRNKYDFAEVFAKPTRFILEENKLPIRLQGLLANGRQTSGDLFSLEPELTADIEKIIRTEVDQYQIYFKDSKEGLITNWPTDYNIKGWLVSMKSGGELQPHMHENGWISGSIYINVPAKSKVDSGNLVVCIEKSSLSSNQINQEKSVDVTTGSLCLFPASLLHYTIPFESEEDRIVLAFDVIPIPNGSSTSCV